MKTQVDPAKFVRAVVDIASGNPGFVYTPHLIGGSSKCVYVAITGAYGEQGADCLIGRALFVAGVPVSELAELDTRDQAAAFDVLDEFGLPRHVIRWAGQVQNYQDAGIPWGSAVSEAGEVPNV